MAEIDDRIERITRSIETLEQTEARHNDAADARLTRIETALGDLIAENRKLGLTVKRMGKFAMVIARIHDDELGSHTKRLLALEAEDNDGDTASH